MATLPGLFVCTDGSCAENGRADARAGFAAVFMGVGFGGTADPSVVRGEVPPFELEFAAGAAPGPGDAAAASLVATARPRAPTNVRGEWLGLVHALLAARRERDAGRVGRVEVATDYQGCVKTLLEWLPARLRRGTERELENFDLIGIAWGLFSTLEPRPVLTWVRGHRPPPPPGAPPRERLLHAGNALADAHADYRLGVRGVEALGGPARDRLARLARPGWPVLKTAAPG